MPPPKINLFKYCSHLKKYKDRLALEAAKIKDELECMQREAPPITDYQAKQPLARFALLLVLEEVAEAEKELGPNNAEVLELVEETVWLHLELKDNDAAEAARERVLRGRVKLLGPDHPATLEAVRKLEATLQACSPSKKPNVDGLMLYLELVGPQDPRNLKTKICLAGPCFLQGQYPAALAMIRREIQRKGLQYPHHAMTALVAVAHKMLIEGVAEAELVYSDAVDWHLAVFGLSDPIISDVLNMQAISRLRAGQFKLAERACQRVLKIQQRAFSNSGILTCLAILTFVYLNQRRFEAVERLWKSFQETTALEASAAEMARQVRQVKNWWLALPEASRERLEARRAERGHVIGFARPHKENKSDEETGMEGPVVVDVVVEWVLESAKILPIIRRLEQKVWRECSSHITIRTSNFQEFLLYLRSPTRKAHHPSISQSHA
ncbi:MAG: hypothetical protein M1829_000372 [Trizodia sp. TS-e1964]|nr:MAG: hypothetical protein M1829_000372 [Trizodia sp. TS-e1964]